MTLPISFDDVSYFKNEYRGDFIITHGVLYYFPHTRVAASRHAREIGGKDTADLIGVVGNLTPFLGAVPWIHTAADKSVKIGKLLRRTFRPTINSPRIKHQRLWTGRETSEALQHTLDAYIEKTKQEPLGFEDDSVPKPIRFAAEEMENIRLKLTFRFDAKFDNHDFRINPLRRSLLKRALQEGGFLP